MKNKRLVSFEKRQQYMGYFFVFPVILGILFVFIPNMFTTLQFSFNEVVVDGSERYSLVPRGIEYYKTALTTDPEFIPRMISSYRTLAINVPVILIFSMLIASLLNQNFRGRAAARAIFFIPVIISTGILKNVESGIIGMMGDAGVSTGSALDGALAFNMSGFLTSLNFNETLIGIVESSVKNIYSILISSGMQIYIFLAGIQEIPDYLYEAAAIEGCSKWESFWKITFPMLSPQIAVNLIYTIVMVGQGSDALTYANHLGTSGGNYGLSNAMSVLYFLTLLIVLGAVFGIMGRFSGMSSMERGNSKK